MLKVTLLEHEAVQLSEAHTKNKDAYDSYLKGRYFWNRRDLKKVRFSLNKPFHKIQILPRLTRG